MLSAFTDVKPYLTLECDSNKIHHQGSFCVRMIVDFLRALGASKVLDVRRRIADPAVVRGRNAD
jgi:hypothetical protein